MDSELKSNLLKIIIFLIIGISFLFLLNEKEITCKCIDENCKNLKCNSYIYKQIEVK